MRLDTALLWYHTANSLSVGDAALFPRAPTTAPPDAHGEPAGAWRYAERQRARWPPPGRPGLATVQSYGLPARVGTSCALDMNCVWQTVNTIVCFVAIEWVGLSLSGFLKILMIFLESRLATSIVVDHRTRRLPLGVPDRLQPEQLLVVSGGVTVCNVHSCWLFLAVLHRLPHERLWRCHTATIVSKSRTT